MENNQQDIDTTNPPPEPIPDPRPTNFGALIIGPSGSGKSTLCDGLQQFMNAVKRDCCLVNLDPANDTPKYRVPLYAPNIA